MFFFCVRSISCLFTHNTIILIITTTRQLSCVSISRNFFKKFRHSISRNFCFVLFIFHFFFRPMNRLREWLRVHEYVADVAAVVVVAAVGDAAAVANDQHVHCNHLDIASSFEDDHYDFDCFSFCLCLLGHTLVHPVWPEKILKFKFLKFI